VGKQGRKDVYDTISKFARTELCNALFEIYETLYVEDGEVNPDKQWSADTFDALSIVMHRYKLTP
jgi:hypothetical protein